MKKNLQDISIIVSLFIITLLICMRSPINIFSNSLMSQADSAVFKYIGWRMTQGEIPYIDIFDHKGLLIYFINYLGALISPIKGVWLIEFALMFGAVFFAYKLSRKFTSRPISLFITIIAFLGLDTYFEGGNLTEGYALTFQIVSLYIFFDFFLNPDKYSSSNASNSIIRLNYKWFNVPVFICRYMFFLCSFFKSKYDFCLACILHHGINTLYFK